MTVSWIIFYVFFILVSGKFLIRFLFSKKHFAYCNEVFYDYYKTVLKIYEKNSFFNDVFIVHTFLLMLGCQHSYLMVLWWLYTACHATKKSQNIPTDHCLITNYSCTITKTADRMMPLTSGIILHFWSKKVERCINQLYFFDILPFHLEINAFRHNNIFFSFIY